jgi:hypothetical protein
LDGGAKEGTSFYVVGGRKWGAFLFNHGFSCRFDKTIFACNEIMPLHVWGARRWGVKENYFLE